MPLFAPFEVRVPDGTLHGGVLGTQGPVVLCAHGITGNHVSYEAMAEALGAGVRVIAIDLRGRGGSAAILGPWGMERHAADLAAVLDHLRLARADVLVGHSMGGFVCAQFSARYPDRVGAVVMVDGGIPLVDRLPEGVAMDDFIQQILGPAIQRLDMRFESRKAYHDFWRAHPSLGPYWSTHIEHYVDYDLVGQPPQMQSSVRKEAVFGDARSLLDSPAVAGWLEQMRGPVRFVRAPRGMIDAAPLYGAVRLAPWAGRVRGFRSVDAPDTNHYTVLLNRNGAEVVAGQVREVLETASA